MGRCLEGYTRKRGRKKYRQVGGQPRNFCGLPMRALAIPINEFAVHAIADRTCSMADRAVKNYRFEKEFDAVQDVFELQVCSCGYPNIV